MSSSLIYTLPKVAEEYGWYFDDKGETYFTKQEPYIDEITGELLLPPEDVLPDSNFDERPK